MKKRLLLFTFFIFVVFATLFLSQKYFSKQESDERLVEATSILKLSATPVMQASLASSEASAPTLTPTPLVLKKTSYTIAIFGDSMVDTMGEKLEILQKILDSKYPKNRFNLYNYGIGGQNVEQGLGRFESSFVNRERQYPPLPALAPDVLIVGSFAYNPFSTHDRNKHYALLKDLFAKAKNVSSNVYLLAEIAPLKTGFGKGKNGINMEENVALEHASRIIEQLDDAINLSKEANIPLINAYYKSRIDGSFGDPYLVNKDDGIHPSVAGHYFTAELIVKSIKFD